MSHLLQCRYRILALQWRGTLIMAALQAPKRSGAGAFTASCTCLSMLACMAAWLVSAY
jgi:hypothetical protein